MEINATPSNEYFQAIGENFDEQEDDLQKQEKATQKQFKKISKNFFSNNAESFSDTLCARHKVSADAIAERIVNERCGEVEYKGHAEGIYKVTSDDRKNQFSVKAEADTKGNGKVQFGVTKEW